MRIFSLLDNCLCAWTRENPEKANGGSLSHTGLQCMLYLFYLAAIQWRAFFSIMTNIEYFTFLL